MFSTKIVLNRLSSLRGEETGPREPAFGNRDQLKVFCRECVERRARDEKASKILKPFQLVSRFFLTRRLRQSSLI